MEKLLRQWLKQNFLVLLLQIEEEGAASASKPVDNPEAFATSTPGSESVMTISSLESSLESRKFSFASPVPESLRQHTSDEASASIILTDKKGEVEQEENKSFDSSPQALTEEEILPQESQEEVIPDLGNEKSLKTDNSDDSEHDRTEDEEYKLAHENLGKLFKLGFKYVVKFFGEMGPKLSKRNFGQCTVIPGRWDPRAAISFGKLKKDELRLFNTEARVFILQRNSN